MLLYLNTVSNAILSHYHTMAHFDALKINSCGKIVRKGEIPHIAVKNIVRKGEVACNKQFLLFSQCFLRYMALTFHLNAL